MYHVMEDSQKGKESMQALKDRIRRDGRILPGSIVKVDSFLNHQMDPLLMRDIGCEFRRRFAAEPVTRILTIESSGIAAAIMTGLAFGVPVVFAKKHKSANMGGSCYTSPVYSYTKATMYDVTVSSDYLGESDHVLIIDDFLATGNAVKGLLDIVRQSGASLAGIGIVIEKSFQDGGRELRAAGRHVESLAKIHSISNAEIVFED
jgi:xanthine phosphoribosyltransferase